MLSGLIIGLVFSIVPLWFYHYWNGKPAQSLRQHQWVIRGGTAFAQVVKTAFAAATPTAYAQALWRSLRKKDVMIKEANSMFAISSSALGFSSLKVWLGRPELLFIAVVTW